VQEASPKARVNPILALTRAKEIISSFGTHHHFKVRKIRRRSQGSRWTWGCFLERTEAGAPRGCLVLIPDCILPF